MKPLTSYILIGSMLNSTKQTATLKETLRLCPIISSRMPMVTDVDISYGKYRIPPGVCTPGSFMEKIEIS